MPRGISRGLRVPSRQSFGLALLMLLALLAGVAPAYDGQLTPAALHDAYVLGQRNDQATAAFLSPYVKQLTDRAADPPAQRRTATAEPGAGIDRGQGLAHANP